MNAELKFGRINIFNCYYYKEIIKQISGRYWHADKRAWSVPFTEENILFLESLGCKFDKNLQEKARHMITNKPHIPVKADPLEPMPIKAVPYIHQIEAYNRACFSLGFLEEGDILG
jgi:hypothetical protein